MKAPKDVSFLSLLLVFLLLAGVYVLYKMSNGDEMPLGDFILGAVKGVGNALVRVFPEIRGNLPRASF